MEESLNLLKMIMMINEKIEYKLFAYYKCSRVFILNENKKDDIMCDFTFNDIIEYIKNNITIIDFNKPYQGYFITKSIRHRTATLQIKNMSMLNNKTQSKINLRLFSGSKGHYIKIVVYVKPGKSTADDEYNIYLTFNPNNIYKSFRYVSDKNIEYLKSLGIKLLKEKSTMLYERIYNDFIQTKKDEFTARKNNDDNKRHEVEIKKSILTLLYNNLKNKKIELRSEDLSDADAISIIKKLSKQLDEEIEMNIKANREEKAHELKSQKEIIEYYLPQQMSEDKIREIISSLEDKSMPTIMKHFKSNYAGQVDMSLVSKIAREN